jgi:hypothetical protein
VSAATEYVALCVRSEKRQRAVTMRTGEGAQLSAEAGLEVFACERGGRSCKSVKTLFGEGEYFPADFAFDFEGRAGHYRVEFGVCDKAQEVCIPGQVEFRLTDGR